MYLQHPKILHLELTSYCNAQCPMCARTLNPLQPQTLSFDTISTACQGMSFDQIIYCGNDGDPLMAHSLMECVQHFAPAHQLIHTNGSIRSSQFWTDLAAVPNVEVVFAIDGADTDTHTKYRVGTNFNTILQNAQSFNTAGGKSRWQFIVFEHNKHQIEQAKRMATQYGFADFELRYSRRDDVSDIKAVKFFS